ncbi:MAG: acyl-ACP--UDP-N-acetylglucosamine O-acyltransferase [Nitrospinales bacterium]
MSIHSQALVHPDAVLGEHVSIGPFSVIGPEVAIGDNTEIGSNIVIESRTVIGKDCRIFHGACIGGMPQILGFEDVPSSVRIGDDTIIREYVTIHRSGKENGVTVVGNNTFLMAYCHLAHDCQIGDHVKIVNGTGLPGHVVVEDYAFVSGLTGIHQFVRIGKHAMVGGMAAIRKDVLPFSLVEGNPARLVSLNSVGLRRSNISSQARAAIKKAMKIIQHPEMNTTQAIEKIESEIEMLDEISYLINFIKNSSRGITK